MTDLTAILSRLEAATSRLEKLANGLGPTTNGTAATGAPAVNGASGASSRALAAWDDLVASYLPPVEAAAQSIGGLVQEQFTHFKNALNAQRNLIELASNSKKPAAADLPKLVVPLQEEITKVIALKDKNRPSPLFTHLSVVAEGIPALGWVMVEPTPGPYVAEMREAALFYINRLIKDTKEKEKFHGEFANGYKEFLVQLQAYVKANHTTGLTWNPKGGDAASFKSAAPSAAPAAPSGAAPPPPPAPTAEQLEQFAPKTSAKPAGAAPAALFSELNSGNLTAGLRKVDKSEMTHKNPELRASGVVKVSESKDEVSKSKSAMSLAPKQPPKCVLQGNKWVIENYVEEHNLVLEDVQLKHVVYIYNCQQMTVQIKGKVNAVSIDNCKKTGVVVNSVVSTIDVVNCKSAQVQITGQVPTVVVDKTEGLQIYLSNDSLATELFTAKSSGVNLLHQVDGEFVEKPVPEQLKTVLKGNKLESSAVEHKG